MSRVKRPRITAEGRIERRLIRHRDRLGYRDAGVIRRARLGRDGSGSVDIIFLPKYGRTKLVLVEVKQHKSGDTAGRVVGQLLQYYAAALRLGANGLRSLREFASEDPERAARASPKSLKMLSGGFSKPRDLREMRGGRPLRPAEVRMILGVSRAPKESLAHVLRILRKDHGLPIKVIIAPNHRDLIRWPKNSAIPRTRDGRSSSRQ